MIGRRRARTAVVELDAGQLGLDPSTVGLAASPTKVAHMEPVHLPERSCRFVGSEGLTYDRLVRPCRRRSPRRTGRRLAARR